MHKKRIVNKQEPKLLKSAQKEEKCTDEDFYAELHWF